MTSKRTVVLVLLGTLLAVPAWAQNGTVSGRVTNATTGAPLPGVQVTLCRRQYGTSTCLSPALTNAAGFYAVSAPADTYYAYTRNSLDYVDEIYDNRACVFSCSQSRVVEHGTPIIVGAGMAVSGRDFALEPGGILTGTVRAASTGAPLSGVSVSITTMDGGIGTTVSTDVTGRYVFRGLATASYSVKTQNRTGYTNEVYDNFLCPYTCLAGTQIGGTPIPVTAGTVTWDKDFALDVGGRISGVVTDVRTSAPVAGQVYVVGESSAFIGFFPVDSAGRYEVTGLPAGRYFAITMTDHADEMFDDRPWPGRLYPFDLSSRGTPIIVSLGATTTANFALEPAGAVSGRITRTDDGTGVESYCVTLLAPLGGSLVEAGRECADASGHYSVGGLHAGSYFAITERYKDLITELYDTIPCPGWSCDIASGTPIVVTAGETTAGTDFALDLGGKITGILRDAVTGAPLEGEVFVFSRLDGIALQVGWEEEESSFTVSGLPTGSYYAFGRYDSGYLDQAFDNVTCTGGQCTAEQMAFIGTPIDVTAGGSVTAGIDFALERRIFSGPPGPPRDLRATVDAYSVVLSWWPAEGGAAPPTSYVLEAGQSPGTTMVSVSLSVMSHLSYVVRGVAPGRYYVRVRGRNDFGTGPPSNEQEVVVNPDGSGPMEPPGGLSAWMSGRRLTLTWSPPESGGIPAGYVVEAGTAAGLQNIGSINTTARAFTYDGVPDGFYFVRVRARRDTHTSAPSTEIMVNVGGVAAPPGAPANLAAAISGATVALTWTAPPGDVPSSYIVEAGSGPGLSNLLIANTGTAATSIAFGSVPPGRYYVRVRAVNGIGAGVASSEVPVIVP